jgi:ADP-ribosylglycohydrolase
VTGSERPSDFSIFLSRMRRTPWRKAIRQAVRARGRAGSLLLPERLEGAIYGHLCGDALGVPYEYQSPAAIDEVVWRGDGTYALPAGTWSDDGALMLALLDSLLEAGFDTEDQGRRVLAWRDEGRYAVGGEVFDVGTSTTEALHALRSGTPAERAGAVQAKGNGSLMRILPLPLVLRDVSDAELLDLAFRASRVTHGSAEAQIACGLYVLIVRGLLGGSGPAPALAAARSTLRRHLAQVGLRGSAEAADPASAVAELTAFEAWPERSGRGRAVDSFWSAWDAFVRASDYRSTVVAAVEFGHDTDTTGAIAGGMAGACFGVESVPVEWRRGLRDRPVAQTLVDRLVETDTSEFGGTPWSTSSTRPLPFADLDLAGTDLRAGGGSAGMTFLPGKRYLGYYKGPQWRDLPTDLAALQAAGVDVLLLLVEDHELERCRVPDLADVLPEYGIELVRHPVPDPLTPTDDAAYRRTIVAVADMVRDGRTLAVACRGGLDRTGMTAGCLLREGGLDADAAIDRVHAARRHTLTMPDQLDYVRRWPRT